MLIAADGGIGQTGSNQCALAFCQMAAVQIDTDHCLPDGFVGSLNLSKARNDAKLRAGQKTVATIHHFASEGKDGHLKPVETNVFLEFRELLLLHLRKEVSSFVDFQSAQVRKGHASSILGRRNQRHSPSNGGNQTDIILLIHSVLQFKKRCKNPPVGLIAMNGGGSRY